MLHNERELALQVEAKLLFTQTLQKEIIVDCQVDPVQPWGSLKVKEERGMRNGLVSKGAC